MNATPTHSADRLLAFSFRAKPTFRMGFDGHVRQWDKAMRRKVWVTYYTDPEFAAAYQQRVQDACRGLLVKEGV